MQPRSGYYVDAIAEAAALWESLSQNHPFVDGNKRTAIAATAAHLAVNGYCRGLSLPSMIPSMMLRPVPPMMWLTTSVPPDSQTGSGAQTEIGFGRPADILVSLLCFLFSSPVAAVRTPSRVSHKLSKISHSSHP